MSNNGSNKNNSEIKTYYKGLGLCSFGAGANSAEIDVKDGKIIRTRPLQYFKKYSKEEVKPWKIEVRGKTLEPKDKTLLPPHSYAYKKRALSPNRILYPMKRVDWDPEGERNPQNRGKSKYVRISWDEATDLIAKELRRIQKKYGPYAVFAQCDGHGETKVIHGPHGCQCELLELMGGFTEQARQPDSWEGWFWGAKHVWGQDPVGQATQINLFKDCAENTQMLLFWGCDQETNPWGWGGLMASRLSYFYTDIGIKQVYISPDLNYAAAVHADKWIPVLPNTDAAMQLAIAYTWITEDTYDKEYVATHVHGFEEFKNYILGQEDGVPKTPKWAAEFCGVPSRTIKALARQWAKMRTSIAHCNGGSYIRSAYSSEPGRLEVCLLGMQGLGKPGCNQLILIGWGNFGLDSVNPSPRPSRKPHPHKAYRGKLAGNTPQFLPKTLVPKAILTKEPITWYSDALYVSPRENQFVEYKYPLDPEDGGARIRMIWSDSPCWTVCWNGGNNFVEALRDPEIEFFLVQHPWMENDCLFADILLPINTKYEEEDIQEDGQCGQLYLFYHEEQCIEPTGESKSDYEAVCEIAKKLGLYKEYTEGKSIKDWVKVGFEGSGLEDVISFEDWMEKGYYVVPPAPDWQDDPPGLKPFADDPRNNPLKTPTGKLEFSSTDLAEYFPDDKERPPVPHWIPYGETHQESLLCERAKDYPFLLLSNHPRWRVHANMDDISWFREIPTCKVKGPDGYLYEPLWINPVDAQKLGINSGDVVKLVNERGYVLGGAMVTERIMPGVVSQDHGARLDPIVPGESDRSGSNNMICPTNTTSKNCVGEVTSGFLVAVEKADIDALRAQYPEVFSRKYDAASGLVVEAWLEEGK